MADKNLELALRIKTDLEQGRRDLEGLGESVAAVGEKATVTSKQLGRVGETADQQAARIKAVVQASLAQQSAMDSVTSSTVRQAAAARETNARWLESAAAQNAAMNAYHNAERAMKEKASAEQRATEQAAKARVEAEKQDAALRKLLGAVDRTERELAKLDRQQQELSQHHRQGRLDAEAYGRALDQIRSRRDTLTGVSSEARRANVEFNGLTASIRRAYGLLATGLAGYGVASVSRQIVNTNLQWQQAIFTMEAATGSAAQARQELEFVREVSERLGLELLSTSQSYARLVAAAKESPELGKQVQSIFEGVASAATTLHLSKEEVNGLLLALEQMVSKGKVQSQELVLQLGQRVPGAFSLAAKALGTNTEQLNKWLEKGQIAADQFLPRFAAALQDAYGPKAQEAANGLQGQINRLHNEFTQLQIEAGEAGFVDSWVEAVKQLRDVLRDPAVRDGLNSLIQGLGKVASVAAQSLGSVAGFTKFIAEEIAARTNGPSGDDSVRLEDAIEREAAYMARIQAALDEAYAKNDQKRIARYEEALTKAQEQIQQWQSQLDGNLNRVVTTPVTSTTAPTSPLKPFVPSAGEDKAAARLAKQNEDWVKQLEKEAATYGKGKAALREYELEQRNLTGALEARARAAWVTLDAAEKQKKADEQAKKDARTLAQLQIDYMRATGQAVDAAGAEIEKKYGALQKRLEAAGNTDGAGLVSKLIDIEKAKAEMEQLDQALERVFAEQARREQTINTQQQAGLISELGARQQILDLNKLTADQVEKLLPKMRELAAVTGDPAAIERVKDLETRLGNLRIVANEFSNALKAGFETGIQGALRGLADGTMDLQEAALSFVQSITSSLADLAAQQLAQQATAGLMSLFGGGGQGEADMVAGAAAVTSSAGALSVAGGTLLTGAAAIEAAAVSLAAANGAGGSTGVSSGSGNSGWLKLAMTAASSYFGGGAGAAASSAYTGAYGFADGGHITGPGTETSDSIAAWLSNNEFVTRAAVVTQPGALDFLHDFNARGMAALNDWNRVRHSTGGLAGVPAPALPSPGLASSKLAEPAAAGATVHNRQNFILMDDPARVADAAFNSRAGEENFVVMLSRDPAKFRSILGIN